MPFQARRSSCNVSQSSPRTASSILSSSISMNIRVSHQETQRAAVLAGCLRICANWGPITIRYGPLMKVRKKGNLKPNSDRLLSCDPAARDQSLRDQATCLSPPPKGASPDAPAACPMSVTDTPTRTPLGDHWPGLRITLAPTYSLHPVPHKSGKLATRNQRN